jgi:hypothetical protein
VALWSCVPFLNIWDVCEQVVKVLSPIIFGYVLNHNCGHWCVVYWCCKIYHIHFVATLLLEKWEDDIHTLETGTLESIGTPKTSKFNFRGQYTLHWNILYIIGKLSKCKCRKWARMNHLDIWKTSYVKKKGRESNWQFDSRPLKVRNRPDSGVCRGSATHRWKDLNKGYNFALDLIPIGGLHKKLCAFKVTGVQVVGISRLPLGSPGTKSHLDVALVESCRVYYKGEGDGFRWIWAVVSLMSPESPAACRSTKVAPENELTNLLVGWMQIRVSN